MVNIHDIVLMSVRNYNFNKLTTFRLNIIVLFIKPRHLMKPGKIGIVGDFIMYDVMKLNMTKCC